MATQADTVEHLENKMVAQETVIANVELRNAFSLHCLHMETQLVHAHLEILATVLQSLVSVQIRGHSEVSFFFFSSLFSRLITFVIIFNNFMLSLCTKDDEDIGERGVDNE